MGAAPWAILDFPGPDGKPHRRVYRNPVSILTAADLGAVIPTLDRVEAMAASGHHLVGFIAYDAAPAFDSAFVVHLGYEGPLVWFAAFAAPSGEPVATPQAPIETWTPDFDPAAHRDAVHQIISGIERGDFYQVNFTGRFRSTIDQPLAVYERVREAQGASYSAFIATGDLSVISVSPELFMSRKGRLLESRPMKGTSPRGRWAAEDLELARALSASEKERAENVMIVDLIRSDMGRIAVAGSVTVPSMFTVEKYPTVLQMTSHVKSQVVDSVSLADAFGALFPCGSITGAPKIAASQSIAALETEPRGVYCGAIGVVGPGRDFIFNVAIRTITVSASGEAVYGAGGGITADSDPGRELEELHTKAAVLNTALARFDLIETMRLEDGQIPRLDRHLGRLRASADYFGFSDPTDSVDRLAASLMAKSAAHPKGLFRVRALLRIDGTYELQVEPFNPSAAPRRLGVSPDPVDSANRFLYHKTSERRKYADRLSLVADVDDVILVNERGEVTETTIGNLVLDLNGALVTPTLGSGLLPGVLRAELLAKNEIREGVIYPADLGRCSRIWMINSLRGWVECVMS